MLEENFAFCPYCGEQISILLDTSLQQQKYIEDCEVCCRPITVLIDIEQDGEHHLQLLQENDVG